MIFIMAGITTNRRTRVVLDRLERGNGAVRRPKALFLSYSSKASLIKLTQSDTLRYWPKLEVSAGVVV